MSFHSGEMVRDIRMRRGTVTPVYDLKSGDLAYVDDEWTDCSQYSVFGNLLLYKAYPWKQSVMGIRPGVYLYDLCDR